MKRCGFLSTAFLALILSAAIATAGHASSEPDLAPAAVQAFDREASGKPVWHDDAAFDALLIALEGLPAHGMYPEHYHLSALKRLRDEPAARDRQATDAWFSAAAHMVYGKLDPLSMEPDWTAARREADLPAILRDALRDGTVARSLSTLAPKQPTYSILMAELHSVRTLMDTPPEPIKPPRKSKSRKKREKQAAKMAARTKALRAWLVQLDLLGNSGVTGEMDDATLRAVKGFQAEAGLSADGDVDSDTIDALRGRLQKQMDQLRVNLERWRWLPNELGRLAFKAARTR